MNVVLVFWVFSISFFNGKANGRDGRTGGLPRRTRRRKWHDGIRLWERFALATDGWG